MALLNKEVPLRPQQWTQISFFDGNALDWQGDLLVIGLHEEAVKGSEQDALGALNKALGGILQEFVDLDGFTGALGTAHLARRGGGGTRFVAAVGLGPINPQGAPWGPSPYRQLGEQAAALAKGRRAKSVATMLLSGADTSVPEAVPRRHEHVHDLENRAGDIALGLLVGGYKPSRFSSAPTPPPLERAAIFSLGVGPGLDAAAQLASNLAQGLTFARYMGEAPANLCTPAYVAGAAQSIAAAAPDVMRLEVLSAEDCAARGMGLFLAVARGSTANPPHFVHLTYTPKASHQGLRKVALVGKTVCFDTGGYNLKVAGGIEHMKMDMCGGAAVLGAAEAISQIQPEGVEVHFILPATENMVDGSASRPSDIVSASNGKTVEIVDTDAEGRLTLADALVYAEQLGVEAIVDIATLTGAGYVALGASIGNLFTDSTALAGALRSASQAAGERIWQQPIEDSYFKDNVKSSIADLKNYPGSRAGGGAQGGGAIMAALFLREFIKDKARVQWAHIDAAGPMIDFKSGGASGWGALTLVHWVMGLRQAHTTAVFGFKDIPPSPPKQPSYSNS